MKAMFLFKTSIQYEFSFTFTTYLLSGNLTAWEVNIFLIAAISSVYNIFLMPVKTISTLKSCFWEICFLNFL